MRTASSATPDKRSTRRLPRIMVGLAAFALPVFVVLIGMRLDRAPIQPADRNRAALIEVVLWGSIVVAALVPGALIMTSAVSWLRRIGLTIAMLCLLVVECGFTFYIALLSGLR